MITPVGRVIRKLRIDEIPQLFNVLSGNMSLVGPRPERPEFIEMYSKKIPEFSYRLKVKGGLTGYAQILGKYNTTAYDKLKLDLMYIENYSFSLDLKLLLMTFKVIFQEREHGGLFRCHCRGEGR
ncbi:MAG: sugar transferase [Clostridia bacterium]